jgi:hypothetical protein
MPVQACQADGRPGWRWGEQGKCYPYPPGDEAASNQAKKKAYLQGYAAEGGSMSSVTKQSPDAGDVHVPGLFDGKGRRKKSRRASDRIMTDEGAPESAAELASKGDVSGHEFHGNQYTDGGGGGSAEALPGGRVPAAIAEHALTGMQVMTPQDHVQAALNTVRGQRGNLPVKMTRQHFETAASHIRDHVPAEHQFSVAHAVANNLEQHNALFNRDRFVRASQGQGSMTPRRLGKDESFFWVEKAEHPQQIVRGIVLVPDLIDSQSERVNADEIEKAAHQWMLDWQEQGVQHYGNRVPEIRPVESYVAPADFVIKGIDGEDHTVPKGTWVMASKVGSPRAWNMVLDGELSGYSIQGSAIKHEVSL